MSIKKSLCGILACVLSLVIALAAALSIFKVNVYADDDKVYNNAQSYDIKSAAYINFVNGLTRSSAEDKLIAMDVSNGAGIGGTLIHYYIAPQGKGRYGNYIREYANIYNFKTGEYNGRAFSDIAIYKDFVVYMNDDHASLDEINAFLEESDLKAVLIDIADYEGWKPYGADLHIEYDASLGEKEKIDILYALYKEFNLHYALMEVVSGGMTFFEEEDNSISALKGDANLDSIVDIADLTTVAKYDLNNKLYPLVNDAAFSNADMNGDGEVNGLDTSALIENQLGK